MNRGILIGILGATAAALMLGGRKPWLVRVFRHPTKGSVMVLRAVGPVGLG